MGIIINVKVVQLAVGLCLLLVPESSSSLCPHRRQYWHEELEKCVDCTTCEAGEIVIRPCQVHRDAQCGPISELNIDWSFLTRREHKHHLDFDKTLHHKHSTKHTHPEKQAEANINHENYNLHKEHHNNFKDNHRRKQFDHEISEFNSKAHKPHLAHHKIKPETLEIGSVFHPMYLDTPREISRKVAQVPESAALHRIPTSSAAPVIAQVPSEPFSTFEKLVWDWQAVVLILAVFACLFFFLVTGIYLIYHIHHWCHFKGNVDSNVEEAYARRSLMVPGHAEAHGSPPPLDSYVSEQGLCMDHLLDLKNQEDVGTTKENVYIVRDKSREDMKARSCEKKKRHPLKI